MDRFNKIVGKHTCPGGSKCKNCSNPPKKLLRRQARAAMKREIRKSGYTVPQGDDLDDEWELVEFTLPRLQGKNKVLARGTFSQCVVAEEKLNEAEEDTAGNMPSN